MDDFDINKADRKAVIASLRGTIHRIASEHPGQELAAKDLLSIIAAWEREPELVEILRDVEQYLAEDVLPEHRSPLHAKVCDVLRRLDSQEVVP